MNEVEIFLWIIFFLCYILRLAESFQRTSRAKVFGVRTKAQKFPFLRNFRFSQKWADHNFLFGNSDTEEEHLKIVETQQPLVFQIGKSFQQLTMRFWILIAIESENCQIWTEKISEGESERSCGIRAVIRKKRQIHRLHKRKKRLILRKSFVVGVFTYQTLFPLFVSRNGNWERKKKIQKKNFVIQCKNCFYFQKEKRFHFSVFFKYFYIFFIFFFCYVLVRRESREKNFSTGLLYPYQNDTPGKYLHKRKEKYFKRWRKKKITHKFMKGYFCWIQFVFAVLFCLYRMSASDGWK